MLDKKIALVSKNQQRMDFLELACRMHGFSVERFGKMPPTDESYFLIFWDKDSVPVPSVVPSNVVTISSSEGEDNKGLLWPTSLSRLEELLLSYTTPSNAQTFVATANNTIAVYHKEHRQVLFADHLLTLSEYEMRLLERLCVANGDVVPREELKCLLGAESGNIADVYVCHLRRKLEKFAEKRYIQTVRGIGYRTDLIWEE